MLQINIFDNIRDISFMKLSKSDIILIFLVLGISILIWICHYFYSKSYNYQETHKLSSTENFRMPYDLEYVDPFMFYAEVTMEYDPDEIEPAQPPIDGSNLPDISKFIT